MIQIADLVHGVVDPLLASSYALPSFEARANSIVLVTVTGFSGLGGIDATLTGGGLTWTLAAHNSSAAVEETWVWYAEIVADVALGLTVTFTNTVATLTYDVVEARTEAFSMAVRQIHQENMASGDDLLNFTQAFAAANSGVIFMHGVQAMPDPVASGWERIVLQRVTAITSATFIREGGETRADISLVHGSNSIFAVGIEFASYCVPCSLDDPTYTVGTFDLYLTPIDDRGVPGEEALIGNIVTGQYDDNAEPVEAFDPLANFEEPIVVSIRQSERLAFVADEVTCDNLLRFLSLPGINAAGGTTIGVDAVVRPPMYRVTLEHTMPCGHVITRRIHRAGITSRASWGFTPSALHGLPFELRSYPDDRQANVFGYWTVSPATCGGVS